MPAYLLKRLLLIFPTFFGITLVTFFIIKLAPGSPAPSRLQDGGSGKAASVFKIHVKETQKLYGLDVPLPDWYERGIRSVNAHVFGVHDPDQRNLFRRTAEWTGKNWIQYTRWLKSICKFDFGESYKDHRPVLRKIGEALPITLALNFLEMALAYFISIPLGVFSALRKDSLLDRGIMLKLFILYSLPSFWVATILMMFLASGDYLDWFPLGGYLSDGAELLPWYQRWLNVAWHLVLPVTCMVYGSFAFLSRFSRATFLEVIRQDYIRTARAKGLSERLVVWKHAFRNALIPLVTLTGTLLPALMGGSVIIEQIFSIPGMGRLGFEAVSGRDYPTIMGIASIQAMLTLISLLITDFIYTWADPRISFGRSGS